MESREKTFQKKSAASKSAVRSTKEARLQENCRNEFAGTQELTEEEKLRRNTKHNGESNHALSKINPNQEIVEIKPSEELQEVIEEQITEVKTRRQVAGELFMLVTAGVHVGTHTTTDAKRSHDIDQSLRKELLHLMMLKNGGKAVQNKNQPINQTNVQVNINEKMPEEGRI